MDIDFFAWMSAAVGSAARFVLEVLPHVARVAVALVGTLGALGGVWIGAYLSESRDGKARAQRDAADALYLAVTVSAVIEAFVSGCADVAGDDGLDRGQLDYSQGEGIRRRQKDAPTLDYAGLKVTWTALPADLLDQVHSLPIRLANMKRNLSDVLDNDFPPLYDYFHARQLAFAKLGVDAGCVTERLRLFAGLSASVDADNNSLAWLKEKRAELELADARRNQISEEENASIWQQLNDPDPAP